MRPPDGALVELAEACGVAAAYEDAWGHRKEVARGTLRAVLGAMGRPAEDEVAARHQLERLRAERLARVVDPCIVVRRGHERASARLSVPVGSTPRLSLLLEDGSVRDLPAPATDVAEQATINGEARAAADVELPADLPLGYHRLDVEAGEVSGSAHVIVAPERCPLPHDLPASWGWAVQLYALRSRESWCHGDFGDLDRVLAWSGRELGAAFVLCNPLHATNPVLPQQPSPYYPSSKRYLNPLYLRVESLPEITALDTAGQRQVDALAAVARAFNLEDRIDRDATFRVKHAAFELLWAAGMVSSRRVQFDGYREREGQALVDFATFCALAERHGVGFRDWPADLQHPRGPAVSEARAELGDRVDFHTWLQFCSDEQLGAAAKRAREAGMPIGIMADLAVGVDAGGADAWCLQDDLALTMRVGAPPDIFNPAGQNWAQPPFLPERLAESGYAPLRAMLASVMRHAGAVRIDHILGLFRLYWIPEDADPAEGTYVRYRAADLLGVLALEAHRAGAVVVGEDLGTVSAGVRDSMRDHRMLGCSVMYFEQDDDGKPRAAADYRRFTLASVTTHDLPTAAGWWRDESLRTQMALDLLGPDADLEAELRSAREQRAAMKALLESEGLLHTSHPGTDELVDAMHAFLAGTPSLLLAVALRDAVGDLRQPNLPGTIDAYPNWRLPVAEPLDASEPSDGPALNVPHRPLLLDDLYEHPRLLRLVRLLRSARASATAE